METFEVIGPARRAGQPRRRHEAATPLRTVDARQLSTAAALVQCLTYGGTHMPAADLLTLDQVAERLQVSRWTVYQLIWAGDLPSVHLGRCHRVRAQDFERFLEHLGSQAT
ncbi:helix-turn-helix domain-containing protein [Pseudonocardia petroleophila]